MTRKKKVPVVKSPITWILVMDAKQAQIYSRRKVERLIALKDNSRGNFDEIITHEPVPVPSMKWRAEQVQQIASAAQGEIRTAFVCNIAEKLNKAGQRKSFNQLVLIGPAQMINDIKKHLNTKALKHVVAEMPKDRARYNTRNAGRASG